MLFWETTLLHEHLLAGSDSSHGDSFAHQKSFLDGIHPKRVADFITSAAGFRFQLIRNFSLHSCKVSPAWSSKTARSFSTMFSEESLGSRKQTSQIGTSCASLVGFQQLFIISIRTGSVWLGDFSGRYSAIACLQLQPALRRWYLLKVLAGAEQPGRT